MAPKRKRHGAAAAAVERKRQHQVESVEEGISAETLAVIVLSSQAQPEEDLIQHELDMLTPMTPPELPENAIQHIKKRLENYKKRDGKDRSDELLNAFLDFLPQDGQRNLIVDIAMRIDDEKLYELAENIKMCLLKSCR